MTSVCVCFSPANQSMVLALSLLGVELGPAILRQLLSPWLPM